LAGLAAAESFLLAMIFVKDCHIGWILPQTRRPLGDFEKNLL